MVTFLMRQQQLFVSPAAAGTGSSGNEDIGSFWEELESYASRRPVVRRQVKNLVSELHRVILLHASSVGNSRGGKHTVGQQDKMQIAVYSLPDEQFDVFSLSVHVMLQKLGEASGKQQGMLHHGGTHPLRGRGGGGN